MKVKYIRWSTITQTGARQLLDVQDFDLVFQEQISGSTAFAKRGSCYNWTDLYGLNRLFFSQALFAQVIINCSIGYLGPDTYLIQRDAGSYRENNSFLLSSVILGLKIRFPWDFARCMPAFTRPLIREFSNWASEAMT